MVAGMKKKILAMERKLYHADRVAAHGRVLLLAIKQSDAYIPKNRVCVFDDLRDEIMDYENADGHFCPDWDFLFIIQGSKEAEACTCSAVIAKAVEK